MTRFVAFESNVTGTTAPEIVEVATPTTLLLDFVKVCTGIWIRKIYMLIRNANMNVNVFKGCM